MTYYKYHLLIASVCDRYVLVSSEDSSENNLSRCLHPLVSTVYVSNNWKTKKKKKKTHLFQSVS